MVYDSEELKAKAERIKKFSIGYWHIVVVSLIYERARRSHRVNYCNGEHID